MSPANLLPKKKIEELFDASYARGTVQATEAAEVSTRLNKAKFKESEEVEK